MVQKGSHRLGGKLLKAHGKCQRRKVDLSGASQSLVPSRYTQKDFIVAFHRCQVVSWTRIDQCLGQAQHCIVLQSLIKMRALRSVLPFRKHLSSFIPPFNQIALRFWLKLNRRKKPEYKLRKRILLFCQRREVCSWFQAWSSLILIILCYNLLSN